MNSDLLLLLEGLLQGMRSNAAWLLQARRDFTADRIEYKRAGDLVSFVDRESERRLCEICAGLVPDAGFILEEGGDLHADREYRWVIDPLDGTTNFVHDVPAWCMSVALQKQGETVLGVVYDVPRAEIFTAIKGGGAFLNGAPIRPSGVQELEEALLGTGFPYDILDRQDDYLAVLRSFLGKAQGMRRFGAAAIDLCWVACGRLDGFYEKGLQAWDVAAGALVIREAGAAVSDFQGTDNFVFGRNIVAGNIPVQRQMLHVIQERF
jgi:myo-inositol-1(or 4)-monophosphatase